jgi:mono/diheme cytochrome c family protein
VPRDREEEVDLPRALIALVLVAACSRGSTAPPPPFDAAVVVDDGPARALIARFECNRCHDGTGLADAPQEKHCVQCHRAILEDRFDALAVPAADLALWKRHIRSLVAVPSLASARRLRRDWVEAFLRTPHDVRPRLAATMPRLAISEEEAKTIARYLVPDDRADDTPRGDAVRGRQIYDTNACARCHEGDAVTDESRLAPDLRQVRARLPTSTAIAWVIDPASVSPAATMPRLGLSDRDATDVVAYLWTLRAPALEPATEQRLPPLDRAVRFDEVATRVLRKICWHCHGAPAFARGDGGPGNTGGFGFAPRGLDLSDYTGVTSGSRGADGRRRSVLATLPDGTPRLIAHLLARRVEERGGEVPGVRGMPLGLPALSLEDIQLVETWIVQGRPE